VTSDNVRERNSNYVRSKRITSSHLIQKNISLYSKKTPLSPRLLYALKGESRAPVLTKARNFLLHRKPSHDEQLGSKSHVSMSLSILAKVQHWAETMKSWDEIQKLVRCVAQYWFAFLQDLSLPAHTHRLPQRDDVTQHRAVFTTSVTQELH